MTDLAKLTEGTVAEAEKALAKLSDAELTELHDLEQAGQGRTTLLAAIDKERDGRKPAADAPDAATGDDDDADLKARNETMAASFRGD